MKTIKGYFIILGMLMLLSLTMLGCDKLSKEDKNNLDNYSIKAVNYYNDKYNCNVKMKSSDFDSNNGLFGATYDRNTVVVYMNDGSVIEYDISNDTFCDNRQGEEIKRDILSYIDKELERAGLNSSNTIWKKDGDFAFNTVYIDDTDSYSMFSNYYDGDIRAYAKKENINFENVPKLYIKADKSTGVKYLDKLYDIYENLSGERCNYQAVIVDDIGFSMLKDGKIDDINFGDETCLVFDNMRRYDAGKSKEEALKRKIQDSIIVQTGLMAIMSDNNTKDVIAINPGDVSIIKDELLTVDELKNNSDSKIKTKDLTGYEVYQVVLSDDLRNKLAEKNINNIELYLNADYKTEVYEVTEENKLRNKGTLEPHKGHVVLYMGIGRTYEYVIKISGN